MCNLGNVFHGVFFTAPTTDSLNIQNTEHLTPLRLLLTNYTLNLKKGRNLAFLVQCLDLV